MNPHEDGILAVEEIRHLYAEAAIRPAPSAMAGFIDAVAFARAIERAVIVELLKLREWDQVPVTTYLAPDSVTWWPAYSHEQRQEYAAAQALATTGGLTRLMAGLIHALERIALNVSGDDPAQNIAGEALSEYERQAGGDPRAAAADV